MGKEDFLHCCWTLSSWMVATTSSRLYIQSSAQWPVTHLNELIFLFLRNILFWSIFSFYPLYTWTCDTPMSAGKAVFWNIPQCGLSWSLCSCSWTTRLFTYFIFSDQAVICWTQNSNVFFRLCSTGGRVWSFLWLSFLLSWIQWIQRSALVASCQFLSDFSTSYPTFIPMSSLCFHFSY